MIGSSVNVNRFKRGGTITGDYKFQSDIHMGSGKLIQARDNEAVAIELADKTIIHGDIKMMGSILQSNPSANNLISGNLQIMGMISAGNLAPNPNTLPAYAAFTSV